MSWFKKKSPPAPRSLPSKPLVYPNGTCVKTPSGTYYINGKFKQRILSERVLASWAFYNIVETSDVAVSAYKTAGFLPIRSGTLIREFNSKAIYLMVGNKRCLVTSPDVLERLDLTEEDALVVSTEEFKLQDGGEPIK